MKVDSKTHGSHPAAGAAWHVTVLMRGGATRATSVLARRGREVAIFDTGMGHHERSFLAALASEGLTPDEVTLVFNTHGHIDHSHNNVLFPRARVFCSRKDRAWTREVHAVLSAVEHPGAEDVARFYPEIAGGDYSPKLIRKVLGIEKLLWDEARWGSSAQAVWLEDAPLPSGVSLIETPGHSPFHVSFAIETGGRPVLICGDALLLRGEEHYAAPMMPPWSLDVYRASQARIQAFDGIIIPGHDEPYDNVR